MAAQHANVRHMIYVSVAHPAPVMQIYIAARLGGRGCGQRGWCSGNYCEALVCFRARPSLAVSVDAYLCRVASIGKDEGKRGTVWFGKFANDG